MADMPLVAARLELAQMLRNRASSALANGHSETVQDGFVRVVNSSSDLLAAVPGDSRLCGKIAGPS
jgi:hypothetical protein